MDNEPLQYQVIDEPIPDVKRAGRPTTERDTLFLALGTMEPGQAIQVNRSKRSVQYYVQRFRLTIAQDCHYVIRAGEGKWTKVWRVK
jgi:hypothetical protein